MIPAPGRADLGRALEQVTTSLNNQYVVTYAGEGDPGGGRRLELSVGDASRDQRVRDRRPVAGRGQRGSPEASQVAPALRSCPGRSGWCVVVAVGGLAVALAVVRRGLHDLQGRDEPRPDAPAVHRAGRGRRGGRRRRWPRRPSSSGRSTSPRRWPTRQGLLVKIEAQAGAGRPAPAGRRGAVLLHRRRADRHRPRPGASMGLVGLLIFGLARPSWSRWRSLNFLADARQKQFDAQLPDMLHAARRHPAGRLLADAGRRGRVPGGRRPDGPGAAPGHHRGPLGRELEEALEARRRAHGQSRTSPGPSWPSASSGRSAATSPSCC